jgi:YVTN family beta-propeller protein
MVYFLDASATVGSGMILGSVEVGSLPDMVTFTPDGMTVLVANEAELDEDGNDPAGSVSVIDLSNGVANATVATATFDAFNSELATLKAEGVRLFAEEEGFETTTVAQDLEPEYIAISPDGTQAMVTLQENNAVAIIDIATATVVDVVALGLKPFQGLPADFSDRDGGIDLDRGPFNSEDAMLDAQNGFFAKEIFTVGETFDNGYTPPGVMDGIGALELDASTVRVFVNHELAAGDGYAYSLANGTELTGSRISYFDIDKTTMQVKDSGVAFDTVYDAAGNLVEDNSFSINPGEGMGGFDRFCSAALIEADAFGTGHGLVDDVFFTGEETGGEFNAFGGGEWALDVETGELWAVPAMGRGAWENITQVDTGTTTHVAFILADDTSPFDADGDDVDEAAPLYLYVGEKDVSDDAGFLARNGLEGGKLYVWVPDDAARNDPEAFTGEGMSQAGTWVELDNAPATDMASADGSTGYDMFGYPTQSNLWTQAEAVGAFQFSRPEDVATNPNNASEFVLASTGRQSDFNGADLLGELYTMDIAFDFTLAPGLPGEPDFNVFNGASGDLVILYDGDTDPLQTLRSPDNLDWADDGMIYVQEDRAVDGIFGGDAINQSEAGIVRIDPGEEGPNPVRIANIDRSAVPDGATDEAPDDVGNWESSGILDVSALFGKPAGSLFLADVQAHGIDDQDRFTSEGDAARIIDDDLKEGGQLLFLYTEEAGIDVSDTPVYGQFMPDAIASFEGGDGKTYYVIANEGDDRDDFLPGFLDGFEESTRVKDLDLDPGAFPDADLVQQDEALGRLGVSQAPGNAGDIDGDGDIDMLLAYGARSFSILDENGQIVFDSGSHIEQFIALGGLYDEDSNTGLLDDGRSDNKGPEPEGVTIGHFGDSVLAFIAIERGGGGVMVYDVTDPAAVEFVQYLRDIRDISPEGLAYVKAEDSPTGEAVLFVANEVTGTVSAYELTDEKDDTAYLVGIGGRASFDAIISAPETATDGYVFDGTPDGLGVIDLGDGTFRVVVNHEFSDGTGVVRAHGSNGSYVSDLVIDKQTLEVISGQDFLQSVDDLFLNGDGSGWSSGTTTVFNRFCSGDLADMTAFFAGGTGYDGRIYLTGEEAGAEGRAFAHILTGDEAGRVYELPSLGNMSFENVVANPFESGKTVVAGLDDTSNEGQVYFYVGDKQETGNAVEQAGLSGGSLYAVRIGDAGQDEVGSLADPMQTGLGLVGGEAKFTLVSLGDVSGDSGADINDASVLAGATNFLRPEDGAWSADGSTFYFVTTASTSSASRLWALEFDDAGNPVAGGTARLLLDGSEGQMMFDNMTVSDSGKIIIQEDPGSASRLARIWSYDPETDELTAIAEHNPRLFSPESPDLITTNEESSGVIDVSMLFADQPGYSADMNYFLIADQVHADLDTPASAVEYGQITLMSVVSEFG